MGYMTPGYHTMLPVKLAIGFYSIISQDQVHLLPQRIERAHGCISNKKTSLTQR